MPATYPDNDDLNEFLAAAGFADRSGQDFAGLDLPNKIQAAIDAWEQGSEWLPFLSPGVVQTRLFDPPGPPARRGDAFSSLRGGGTRLFIGAGLLALSSVAVAGAEYVQGVQFVLRPDNAALKGKPYTFIEFLVPPLARMGDVAVAGVWGYSLSVPAQVWTAILAQAAALCAPQLALLVSRGLVERKSGDEMEKFAVSGLTPIAAERRMWEAQFAQALEDFGRKEWF